MSRSGLLLGGLILTATDLEGPEIVEVWFVKKKTF